MLVVVVAVNRDFGCCFCNLQKQKILGFALDFETRKIQTYRQHFSPEVVLDISAARSPYVGVIVYRLCARIFRFVGKFGLGWAIFYNVD